MIDIIELDLDTPYIIRVSTDYDLKKIKSLRDKLEKLCINAVIVTDEIIIERTDR